jgi:serine/threonine protein kinase
MRELQVGDRLDQYELTELLARSGMASVYRAKDTATGASVALKVPHLQFESDVVFHERFRREDELGQRLDHPAV